MTDNSEKIMIRFGSSADKLFTHLYNQFEESTGLLDRGKDENVFQQTAARYSFLFKQQLTQAALQLIDENKDVIVNLPHLQQLLTNKLTHYVNAFTQKTKQW